MIVRAMLEWSTQERFCSDHGRPYVAGGKSTIPTLGWIADPFFQRELHGHI